MQKLLNVFFALLAGLAASSLHAQKAGDLGDIIIDAPSAISVHITGTTADLNAWANQAFRSHGRFRQVASGGAFQVQFSPAGGQVNVQVSKAGAVVLNQSYSGKTPRQAFYRAADAAVKAMSGLNGFFASKIAFVSNRTGRDEIYVSDLFLNEVRQITRDNAHAMTPRWAPDGNRLIYTSFFRSGMPDIYLVDLATLQRTTFVSVQGTNSGARFSPSGQQVAMVLSGEGMSEIYVSNASGRQISRRTRSEAVESSPCYSPDGSQIVYASEPGPQLYVMPAGGGPGRRLTSGLSSYCAEPDWSRGDPNKIAFTFREGKYFQIGALDLSTGKSKKVSKAPVDAVEPAWLADGRHLVYTGRAAGSRALFILDTETGRTTRISSVSAEKASVWGP